MAAVLVDSVTSSPGAVLTDLYTVPAGRRAKVSLAKATNITAGALTFRFAVSPNGAAIANAHYLHYGTALAANDGEVLLSGVLLGPGDIVRCYGSTADVSFFLAFYEDDVPSA